MVVMSDESGGTATQRIVSALASAYQRQGYHHVAVPASALLSVTESREELEPALAALLDDGGLVPVGTNGIALHPSARTALLHRAVLETWLDKATREKGPTAALYLDGIASELSTLVVWALGSSLPEDLAQRAAELAGVLATTDLAPSAMDVVATHGGTARGRLAALAALKPRSIAVERLRDHLRHTVSSAYPG